MRAEVVAGIRRFPAAQLTDDSLPRWRLNLNSFFFLTITSIKGLLRPRSLRTSSAAAAMPLLPKMPSSSSPSSSSSSSAAHYSTGFNRRKREESKKRQEEEEKKWVSNPRVACGCWRWSVTRTAIQEAVPATLMRRESSVLTVAVSMTRPPEHCMTLGPPAILPPSHCVCFDTTI